MTVAPPCSLVLEPPECMVPGCASAIKLVAYHRSNESNKELGMHSLQQ